MKMTSIKNKIKQQRYSKNPVIRFMVERLFDFVRLFHTLKGLLTDPQCRAIWYMKVFQSDQVQQTTPETCMNRYPVIFRECAEYWKEKRDLKILSFGCCTGEEVVSLRQYFPDAQIVGAEINKYCLEVCRERKLDEKIQFIESTHENILVHGLYDVVFCMAVLQRTPGLIEEKRITSLKKIYPFEKYEKQVSELDEYVKENGMLVICISQYDFLDTAVSVRYTPWDKCYYLSMLFDKNSQLIAPVSRRPSVFIKNKSLDSPRSFK